MFTAKKAGIHPYIVFLFFLVAIGMFACQEKKASAQFSTSYVGEPAAAMLNTQLESQKMQFYLDEKGKFTIKKKEDEK